MPEPLFRAAAAAAARKPGRSKSATGGGEGCTREGHYCFFPKRGEERDEMENSFSDSQQLEAGFCIAYSMGALKESEARRRQKGSEICGVTESVN